MGGFRRVEEQFRWIYTQSKLCGTQKYFYFACKYLYHVILVRLICLSMQIRYYTLANIEMHPFLNCHTYTSLLYIPVSKIRYMFKRAIVFAKQVIVPSFFSLNYKEIMHSEYDVSYG